MKFSRKRIPRLIEEKLLRQGDVSLLGLDVARDREARRVSALPKVTRVVEADAPRLVVVLSNDARGVVRGRVRGSADSIRAVRTEMTFVLPHRAAALGVAILTEAVGLVELRAAERPRCRSRGAEEQEQPLGSEAPHGVFCGEAAPREPELVVGASRDRIVALLRIERTFEHAQSQDQLGNDEVRIGVAVAVEVPALVDGNAADRELDVLPFARVEAAHEDLLGVSFAAFVGEKDPGRKLEQLGCVLARHLVELAHADVEVGRAAARGRHPAVHGHLGGRRPAAVGDRRRSGGFSAGFSASAAGAARCTAVSGSASAFGSTNSGGGAGGAKWKGTRMRLARAVPSRLAGTNVHWRTATMAA